MKTSSKGVRLIGVGLCAVYFGVATLEGQIDPGPRGGAANAGGPAAGLGSDFTSLFFAARTRFQKIDSVSGGVVGENGVGLGPAFNANSCAACHAQPGVGGSSPHPTLGQVQLPNPQVAFATLDRVPGGNQVVPPFITATGPVREARFIIMSNGKRDGTVHDLYTIAGRVDATGCVLAQPDFAGELAKQNVVFRIPTAIFGLGLVENTMDETLRENLQAVASMAAAKGIHGVLNTDQEGMVTRFGWKAQGRSLQGFAGEHYNIEQGVTNEESPSERADGSNCTFNPTPEDIGNVRNPGDGTVVGTLSEMSSDVVNFALFMRLSAPPTPTTASASELNGKALFKSIGCILCHTETLTTAASPYPGQSGVAYHPYSDFALHRMGSNLADGIVQGEAGPEKFRTAPLWGVGQRVFFLHDGRTMSIVEAIEAHLSGGSEANAVIEGFNALTPSERQDILNFLRSL